MMRGWSLGLCVVTLLGAAPAPAGRLDTSFGGRGMVTIPITTGVHEDVARLFDGVSVAVQSDGKILVVGSIWGWASPLYRLTADGAIDSGFRDGGREQPLFGDANAAASAIAVQPDGRILVAGCVDFGDHGRHLDFALARLEPDGSPDSRFGSNGVVRTDFSGSMDCARAMVLQADGRIVLAGDAFGDFGLARYMPDGSLDAGFGAAGKVRTDLRDSSDGVAAMAILPDGGFLVGGSSAPRGSDFDFAVVRYLADGGIYSSFGTNGRALVDFSGAEDRAHTLTVQPDGRILVAGDSDDHLRKETHLAIARLNPDGSLDRRFGQGGRLVTDLYDRGYAGPALVVLPDGKLVVTGDPGTMTYDFALARYSRDGKPDPTFGEHGKVMIDVRQFLFHVARTLVRQADGRLLVAVHTERDSEASTGLEYAEFERLHSFTLARYLP